MTKTNFFETTLLRQARELGRLAGHTTWKSSPEQNALVDLGNQFLGALTAHTKVDSAAVDAAYEEGRAQGLIETASESAEVGAE